MFQAIFIISVTESVLMKEIKFTPEYIKLSAENTLFIIKQRIEFENKILSALNKFSLIKKEKHNGPETLQAKKLLEEAEIIANKNLFRDKEDRSNIMLLRSITLELNLKNDFKKSLSDNHK
jgi:hypothetical protein